MTAKVVFGDEKLKDEVIVIAIILEWMNHKDYERRFEYG